MLKRQTRNRRTAAESGKTRHADTLVGRQKEIETLIRHIANRESLHIYGAEGTGKSALLKWIYDNSKGIDNTLIPIYCRSSTTLRQIFLYIAPFLLEHFKHLESIDKFKRVKEIEYPSDIKKLSIRQLRNLIFAYIAQDNFCVLLDHLEYVTPKINGFLTTLYEKALVISTSRQSWELTDYGFMGRLDYYLYLIPKLSIENLKRKEAFVLMEKLSNNLQLSLAAKRKLFEEVLRISRGNPEIISSVFEMARRPGYNTDNGLNLNLIMIDSKIEEIA